MQIYMNTIWKILFSFEFKAKIHIIDKNKINKHTKMKQEIEKLLQWVIKKNFDLELDEIKLENPPKKNLWDYAIWCFVLSKDLKKNPAQIAWEIVSLLEWEELIESATAAWPYINIKVNSIRKEDRR